jgi:acyl-CoA-binding protein
MEPSLPNSSILQVFQTTAKLVGETPDDPPNRMSQDEKLRLYGLYKHATSGPCPNSMCYSLNPTVRLKHAAHLAEKDLSKEEAMLQYVQLMASQQTPVGKKCKELLKTCTN